MSELTSEMRQLLAEASVIAEGPAQSFDSPTSHSKAGGGAPRMQGSSLYDRMARRFHSAHTALEQRRAIAWASHELGRARRRPQFGETVNQENYWKLQSVQGSTGMDYRRAAERAGLTEKQVWTIRRNAGLDPRTGYPKAA